MLDWKIFAVGSALFAGMTAVLAKIGVKNVSSNLATLIRTIVIIIFLGMVIGFRREWKNPFLCLAFGKPLHQLPSCCQKAAGKENPPPARNRLRPFLLLKFNLTYISLGDNIITTSDNGGCYAR